MNKRTVKGITKDQHHLPYPDLDFSHEQGRSAVGLYAVLARDWGDFLEMIGEEEDIVMLKVLYNILTLPNPKHDVDTIALNNLGAGLVRGTIFKKEEK